LELPRSKYREPQYIDKVRKGEALREKTFSNCIKREEAEKRRCSPDIFRDCSVTFIFYYKEIFRMKNSILTFISVSMFVFASSAMADNYVTGKVGIYFPSESAFDNGFNIEAAYGMDIFDMTGIDNLALEVGLGYYKASWDQTMTNTFSTSKTDADLTVIPLTATAIYTYELDDGFSFFGGAGLGLYWAEREIEITTTTNIFGEIETTSSSMSSSTTNLGLHLVGGGRYQLNDQMALSAELKYVGAGSVSGADVGGMFLNVGIKYNF
jgi:opacity protein-like surface antigen